MRRLHSSGCWSRFLSSLNKSSQKKTIRNDEQICNKFKTKTIQNVERIKYLGSELLPLSLSTGGLTSGLLRTSQCESK
ncbi:hypothetical protein Hanom_Chr05g00445501 [Helianthus anomalus]